jgi:hypothetical protein
VAFTGTDLASTPLLDTLLVRETVWDAARRACRTYEPAEYDPHADGDRLAGNSTFHAYVNLRIDGSLYVGQTARGVSTRLQEHQLADPVCHVGTLLSIRAPSRRDALGLEAALYFRLNEAGLPATMLRGATSRPGTLAAPSFVELGAPA